MSNKRVYLFREGNASMRDLLGGKGANLAEMSNIVVSSYVGGVGAAVGVTLVPSIPHVEVGPLEGALQACFGDLDSALLLVTDLRLPGVRSAGRIVAAPVFADGALFVTATNGVLYALSHLPETPARGH